MGGGQWHAPPPIEICLRCKILNTSIVIFTYQSNILLYKKVNKNLLRPYSSTDNLPGGCTSSRSLITLPESISNSMTCPRANPANSRVESQLNIAINQSINSHGRVESQLNFEINQSLETIIISNVN